MRLGDAAELGLPVAVENDPVDVAAAELGLPAVGFRRVEADVPGRAGRVVGIEQRLDWAFAEELPGDGRGDAVAGHVGQFLVHELRRIGVAFADEAGVEPLLGDALELAEEVELRFLAGIAPFRVEQALSEVEEQRGRPHVAQMLEVQVDALADDAGVARDRWADEVGRQLQDGIVVEFGRQPFLGQFDAIAFDARESGFREHRARAARP